MPEIELPEIKKDSNNTLDSCVGMMVVLIATFIGLCNVKDDNIVQQMQMKQVERNDNWAWFQARNIRQAVTKASPPKGPTRCLRTCGRSSARWREHRWPAPASRGLTISVTPIRSMGPQLAIKAHASFSKTVPA